MNPDILARECPVSDHLIPISIPMSDPDSNPKAIRVLITGDYAIVTADLHLLLELVEGVAVVAETGWGEETLRQVETLRPDIVLLDLDTDHSGGENSPASRLIRQLKTLLPALTVFAITVHSNAQAAGADAVFIKGQETTRLVDAIRNFWKR
jgi:DNA-binding NarL/FixJ family response regulator